MVLWFVFILLYSAAKMFPAPLSGRTSASLAEQRGFTRVLKQTSREIRQSPPIPLVGIPSGPFCVPILNARQH